MATNNYHFITHWRMRSTVEEIREILDNAVDLPRWWPAVYLDVIELASGDANGVGKVISLYTKGWLPYVLRWQFRITENGPLSSTLVAWGDFVGRGIWTFAQDGEFVNITYDWKIVAEKVLLRTFSFIMKPLFGANHLWAMRKGEESLQLELQCRHAHSADERARVPALPATTFGFLLRHGARALDQLLPGGKS